MKPAIAAFVRAEVRRSVRSFVPAYRVPSSVLNEEEHRRYFHDDVPQLERLELLGELHAVAVAYHRAPRWHLDREWLAERYERVAGELRRRRQRGAA